MPAQAALILFNFFIQELQSKKLCLKLPSQAAFTQEKAALTSKNYNCFNERLNMQLDLELLPTWSALLKIIPLHNPLKIFYESFRDLPQIYNLLSQNLYLYSHFLRQFWLKI